MKVLSREDQRLSAIRVALHDIEGQLIKAATEAKGNPDFVLQYAYEALFKLGKLTDCPLDWRSASYAAQLMRKKIAH